MKVNERKRDFGPPDPKRPRPDFGQYLTQGGPGQIWPSTRSGIIYPLKKCLGFSGFRVFGFSGSRFGVQGLGFGVQGLGSEQIGLFGRSQKKLAKFGPKLVLAKLGLAKLGHSPTHEGLLKPERRA